MKGKSFAESVNNMASTPKVYNIFTDEDMSVVCFDCSYLSDLSAVQVTHYSQEKQDMGIIAAESIIHLIQGTSVSSQKFPWQLAIKRSAMPPIA